MTYSKTASFGAEYLLGLSMKFPHPVLEEFETLATMSWLTITHKHVESVPVKERMALVTARIPRMLCPNNRPYHLSATLPVLTPYHQDRPFPPETLEALIIYGMMGLRPSAIWPSQFKAHLVRFIECDESWYGHIFKLRSTLPPYTARVFASYHPLRKSNKVYLFFPTSGEYLAQRNDSDLKDQFLRLVAELLDPNREFYLCDVRGFIFEPPQTEPQSPSSCRIL
ncbi:hypothetical protein [Candidatus Sororendozoicomonas aggregata]|uniref:hypothetical protein n=1 Tax=Candidatus Sororendozoicomonas aggregata TaxID=3073239 RepID=UPI002ED3A326